METESIGSSIAIATAPSISSGPSFGSEIGSSFSFADTISYNAPLDISGLNGGSYNPGLNLADSIPYTADIGYISLDSRSSIDFCQTSVPHKPTAGTLAGIEKSLEGVILDPDLPKSENSETSKVSFAEPNLNQDVEDNLFEPETFLESIYVPDLAEIKPQTDIIEQLITSPEPEIGKVEVEMAEIFAEPLTAPKIEILDKKIEKLVEEVQELTVQTSVIPSEVEDRVWESTQLVEDCRVLAAASPRNDNNELAITSEPQIEIQAQNQSVINAVSEIEKIKAVEIENISEIAFPEIQQSIKTFEALTNAGIKTEQAGILVEQALVRAGTEPEIAKKVKTQMSKVKIANQNSKLEEKDEEEEKIEDEKEKKKKKKIKLKYVVDENALRVRFNALETAIQKAPARMIREKMVKDPKEIVAFMPVEEENQAVKSEILPRYIISILGFDFDHGDGTYRIPIQDLSQLKPGPEQEIREKAQKIIHNSPPVAIVTEEEGGEEVSGEQVKRVFEYKQDPIRQLRKIIIYSN